MPLDTQQIGPGAIRMCPNDNVAVARADLEPGHASLEHGPACVQPVPRGHKVALQAIGAGEPVVRLGTSIGRARHAIQSGQHVHVHNLSAEPTVQPDESEFCSARRPLEQVPAERRAVFHGIVREGGRVGTRNFIGLIPTVNCSATVARRIADHFNRGPGWLPGTIDGVLALTHSTGCGLSADSTGFRLRERTLAGFARHPNFGGLMLIGLGCETMQIERLLAVHPLAVAGGRLRKITVQEEGGSQSTIRRGIAEVAAMLSAVADVKRAPVDASHLTIGLRCGGADTFCSLSANPAVGHAIDLLVRQGGTAILAETPELLDAAQLLTRRAETPHVAHALLERFDWWGTYAGSELGHGATSHAPAAGSGRALAGVEHALGTLLKGGSSSLRAVYQYAKQVTERGLVFMDSPGFDPCSATGQIAGGANLICFTTGSGSPFGCKPAPCLKLASTSQLYHGQAEDMDFNCGTVLEGDETLADCGARIFARRLAVASGERTKSEALGYGDNEFVPWQVGAVC
ncbi:MAG: UxaA family hydrolase [bacterium]|jgi:altronate dehydratase|nr:altronate dehydratase family protein [Betaproteobacteria bacterium]